MNTFLCDVGLERLETQNFTKTFVLIKGICIFLHFFKASSFFFNVTRPKYPNNSSITKFQKSSKCLESNSIWHDAFSAQSCMLMTKKMQTVKSLTIALYHVRHTHSLTHFIVLSFITLRRGSAKLAFCPREK